MKKIHFKFLTILFAIAVVFSGCKKDFELSKATFWPDIKINGDAYVVVPVGTTYADAAATVTVNGAPIDYTTESDVDAETTGAYTVVYSAINEDGISASQTRTVIVVDPAAADDDLSGSYQRNTNTPVSVWSKDPDRPYAYIANNPGGVGANPPFNVTFSAFNVEPGIVVVPLQSVGALAPFYCTSGGVGGDPKIPFVVGASVGSVAYSWYVNGSNFGPAARTFKKI